MRSSFLWKESALRSFLPLHLPSGTEQILSIEAVSAFYNKSFEGGCKNEGLMQYKCMEKEIRKLHGRIFPLCHVYREIFRPECSFGSRELQNSCIQAPDFPPLFPGARGNRNGFCRFVKSFTTNRKHGYHPLQHEPAFPDDKSRVDAGFSCSLALPPDS